MNEGPLAAASSFDRGGSAGYQTRARSRAPKLWRTSRQPASL